MSEESKTKSILERAKAVCLNHKFRFLTPAILTSVILQESEGIAFFLKTDKQYKQNMHTAMATLGRSEEEILKLFTLPGGRIIKFRLEPGTYADPKFAKCPAWPHRVYIASSSGLGQLMGYNLIVGVKPSNYIDTILTFAGDEEAQILRCAQDLDKLLVRCYDSPSIIKKDLKTLAYHMYLGYNSGRIINKDPARIKRALEVVGRL